MMRRLGILPALSIVAAFAALSADAQTGKDDITGFWLFQTRTFEDGCVMNGAITFRATSITNAYACSFTNETLCRLDGDEVEYWRVRESCSAQRRDARLLVSSKIEEIAEVRFEGEQAGNAPGYMPDMFDVTLSRTLVEMNGVLFDQKRRIPVRLWRDAERLS